MSKKLRRFATYIVVLAFSVTPFAALAQEPVSTQQKIFVKTFNPPSDWKVSKDGFGSKGSALKTLTPQELVTVDGAVIPAEVEEFMNQNQFSASTEAVTISGSKGKLVGRTLSAANEIVDSEKIVKRVLIYGAIDGTQYSFVWNFVSNKTGELLTGSLTTLGGDGWFADYKTGEVFGIGSKSGDATESVNFNCLLQTLLSCSNLVSLAACFFTGGATCIDLIYSILIDTACGLAFTCQTGMLHVDSVQVLGNAVAGQQFFLKITGTGFNTSNARVVVTDNGACSSFGACSVPNDVLKSYGTVSSTTISNAPVILAAGSHQVYVQNGVNGPVSNSYSITVNSSSGGTTTTLSGSVSSGQWWTGNFTVPAGKSSVKVTLSWAGTDDLDLHVTSSNGTKYGYSENQTGYSGFWTNPEIIQLQNPASGNWQVRVNGWSVQGSRSFTATIQFQ